jgi:hypothetical protein
MVSDSFLDFLLRAAPEAAGWFMMPEGFMGTKLHDDEAYNFNLEDLLGDVCLLNVVHTEKDGNTYANIQGASPLPKGITAPELFNDKRLSSPSLIGSTRRLRSNTSSICLKTRYSCSGCPIPPLSGFVSWPSLFSWPCQPAMG